VSLNDQCTESFEFNILDCTKGLAVELLSFEGHKEDRKNRLNWETASEYQNEYFIIERSSNGQNFERIGKLLANGNTNESIQYTFEDVNCGNTTWYYRLAIMDQQGRLEYTKIISIDRNANTFMSSIYPNPAQDFINIEFPPSSHDGIVLEFIDLNGAVLLKRYISQNENGSSVKLNISNFPTGIYFVKATNEAFSQIEKLIVH